MLMNRIILLVLFVLATFGLSACEQALFPPNMPRHQYQRFALQRGYKEIPQDRNPLAREDIDLRARLLPKAGQ